MCPRVVLENLSEGKDGIESVMTGRDGRVLFVGKAKKGVELGHRNTKFTYLRSLHGTHTWRLNHLCYVLNAVASSKELPAKVIRPLTRVSLHAFSMELRSFKGACRAVLAALNAKIEDRRPFLPARARIKPRLTGVEIKSKVPSLAKIPLWDWLPSPQEDNWYR
jgi:hypothetical protein